jgi:hypothetical protein
MFLRIHNFDNILNGTVNAIDADPAECRLTVSRHVGFFDKADRLQHISNVIKAPDFSFEHFFIDYFIRNLSCCLFKRDH